MNKHLLIKHTIYDDSRHAALEIDYNYVSLRQYFWADIKIEKELMTGDTKHGIFRRTCLNWFVM